jgi:predicted ATPase/DNA-binding CsgD family transcriptional regulator
MSYKPLPVVSDHLLHVPGRETNGDTPVVVGSQRWYAWLAEEQHRSFSFRNALGTFTVRCERKRHGWYWYIYRKSGGKLRKAYLGKLEEVSFERLSLLAATLVTQPDGSAPVDDNVHSADKQALIGHTDPLHGSQASSSASPVTSQIQPEVAKSPRLRAPLTPLLGRQAEVATACALLRRTSVRLLVVTGPGGIGKTRLALQIATELCEDFPAGVCFVALDALRDPALVAPTILHTLGLHESASASVIDQLKSHLREQHLLLLLDNFEQVSPAAPLLTELLSTCPKLKLLVTSRARLRVRGEHTLVVPPLAVPDLEHLPERETLAQYASVALFLQRSQALQPTFQMSRTNARAIAEICVRLEGMPLALELAAARIPHLPPEVLLSRLAQRLEVLISGPQDAPVRQQTLRNTLAWSYSLLSPAEQWLFRLCAIFARGWTLEAAEAVCASSSDVQDEAAADVLEGMASLIDKNLLYQVELEGAEPRFGMLETTREYGRELLARSGELEATLQGHARYYLALAERAAQAWEGPQFAMWLGRIERDQENLRAAMQWALEADGDPERLEVALRLGSAMRSYWQVRGYFREGRGFLEQALAHSLDSHARLRAQVLNEAVHLAISQGDFAWGDTLCQENLARCRELGDSSAIARALYLLGVSACWQGHLTRASSLLSESLALAQEVGDQGGTLMALYIGGYVANHRGEYARAQAVLEQILAIQRKLANKRGIAWPLVVLADTLFLSQQDATMADASLTEAEALFQELGDKWGIAECHWRQGRIALAQADLAMARALTEQSVVLSRELGNRRSLASALCLLGRVAAAQQDWASARACSEESLAEAQSVHDAVQIVSSLEGLAGALAAERASLANVLWAAQLWGAAEALRETLGVPLPPFERGTSEERVAAARRSIGKRIFSAYWAQGRTMTPEQALAAQGKAATPSQRSTEPALISTKSTVVNPVGLTAREVEVLRWVARGLTDAQIAEQLVISSRTVTSHLSSIYNKLGVSSRSAATRFAVEQQLV